MGKYARIQKLDYGVERAIVWENYKAGVIDSISGEVIVPVIYDELYPRIQTFPASAGVRPRKPELIGFAAFTDEGVEQAFTIDGKHDEWREWEQDYLYKPLSPKRSLKEIEEDIFNTYDKEKLKELLLERVKTLNFFLKHSPENVARIQTTNSRLTDAVRKALELGKETQRKLPEAEITVEIYPKWGDSEIHDIIVENGLYVGMTDKSPCFDSTNEWDFSKACLDDGVSWDEGGFRRPAYQDCFFYRPFYILATDNYMLAFEDVASVREFEIKVFVEMQDSVSVR